MALSDPLTLAEFQERLGLTSAGFELRQGMEGAQSTGGNILTTVYGDPLWVGSLQTQQLRLDSGATGAEARINLLREGRKFLMFPPHQPYPQSDRDGTTTPATNTMNTISANRREIGLTGFPAAFELTAGDYFSFTYSGDYYFHQLLEDATANGSGAVISVEVSPPISSAVAAPVTVTFSKPTIRAIAMKDGLSGSTYSGVMASGFSARWVQAV